MIAYRVQANDGRGPWRPGWSQFWIDGDAPTDRLVESLLDLLPVDVICALPATMHYGSACRSLESLMCWFTPIERDRLHRLGFYPVRLNVDAVIVESQWQLVIGRRRPFDDGATRLRWPTRTAGVF